jgi:hypothetical protein
MEPIGSMLQIKSTSTFSRRIGANGPKAINSNILKREIRYRPGLAKTVWLNSRQRCDLRPATSRHLLLSETRDWIPLPGLGEQ